MAKPKCGCQRVTVDSRTQFRYTLDGEPTVQKRYAPRASRSLPEGGAFPRNQLGPWERTEFQQVKKKLVAAGKTVTPHRLIAGLSLGFWANLFTRAYEIGPDSSYLDGSARKTALWPRHLRAVLPHLPRRLATRDHAYRAFRAVADLRDQVFHHRPIWRLRLTALHVSATDAIGWMSPDLKELTITLDRFPQVVAGGLAPYADHVADFLAGRMK